MEKEPENSEFERVLGNVVSSKNYGTEDLSQETKNA